MSNAEAGDIVTVSRDGVTVEKSFEPDDFPVPAIAFVVTSERDEPVSVRMTDTVPDHTTAEDIGFHPKYGAEYWTVEDEQIVFEREFEAGEEYTTVYGLRGGDADRAEEYLSEPTLETVEPTLEEGEGDSGTVVRDVIGGDSEESGADTGGANDIESAIEAIDSGGDADAETAADEGVDVDVDTDVEIGGDDGGIDLPDPSAATPGATTPGATTPGATAPDSVVSALLEEVRSGDVDESELEDLRNALGVEESDGSVDARIDHLQSSVADLEAYTDALEEFLDEEGDAQSLLRDVQSDLEETNDRLEDVESELGSVSDRVEELGDELESAGEERFSEMEAELEELEAELSELADMRDRLANALGTFASDED